MTPHKHHDLIVAWAKGAKIQYKDKDWDAGPWRDAPVPQWSLMCFYRIKPRQPDVILYGFVVKKYWTNYEEGGSVFICNIDTLKIKTDNVKFIFDGETGKLKKAEVIDEA